MSASSRNDIPIKPNERVDDFLEGKLRLIQSARGYRFSVDALLLAGFVTIRKRDRVVDLGTGCGIIPLMLLREHQPAWVIGLEIQQDLASQAARNARLNRFESVMRIVVGDLRHPPMRGRCCEIVVCNPPYRKKRSGRVNPDRQRAVARHEILATLDDILASARGLLRNKGRLAMVYPAPRLGDLLVRMRGHGLEAKRLQAIHPTLEREAKMVLVEAVAGGRPGLEVLPPLLDQGDYSLV